MLNFLWLHPPTKKKKKKHVFPSIISYNSRWHFEQPLVWCQDTRPRSVARWSPSCCNHRRWLSLRWDHLLEVSFFRLFLLAKVWSDPQSEGEVSLDFCWLGLLRNEFSIWKGWMTKLVEMPVSFQDLFTKNTCLCISIYVYQVSVFVSVLPCVRLHFWVIHLHFFSYHWQPSNTRAWYRYVSRAPGAAVRLWSWSVLSTLVVRHSHVNNPFHTGTYDGKPPTGTTNQPLVQKVHIMCIYIYRHILYVCVWMRTNICVYTYMCVYSIHVKLSHHPICWSNNCQELGFSVASYSSCEFWFGPGHRALWWTIQAHKILITYIICNFYHHDISIYTRWKNMKNNIYIYLFYMYINTYIYHVSPPLHRKSTLHPKAGWSSSTRFSGAMFASFDEEYAPCI